MSESPLAIPLSSVSDSPLDASLGPPPKSHRSADFFDKYLPERYAVFAKNNTGLLFVAASTFFFSCMNLTVKYFLSITSISVVTLIVVRMAITSAGCIIALYFIGDPNYLFGPPEIRNMLAVRGVVGFGGLFSNYQSFKGLSVSDSTAIQFLSPSVTAFLGYMFLAESLSRRELFAGVCCLAGVFLVSRPPFLFGWGNEEILPPEDAGSVVIPGEGVDADITTPERMIAVGWAFAAVASGSTAYVVIRYIGDKAHALHSMAYFSYLCTIVCGLALLVLPGPVQWPDTWMGFSLILLVGIFGFIGQTLLTLGLQREKAGRAGLALYLSVVFALILEFIAWHTVPSFLSFLGTCIILTSAVWVAMSGGNGETKPIDDVESQPISRSTSPMPMPPIGRPTMRGEHYSYETVRLTADDDKDDDDIRPLKEIKGKNGYLNVKRNGIGRRRSSGASSISGFTSGAMSD